MNKNPKISVVMSCYNREKYVKDAIESILNQTYRDFELILIDDCSTDNTSNIIQSYANNDDRIVFIKNPKNMNYNYNLRIGFELAKGEYIARMDDDDISLPTRFEKQINYLEKNLDITVLGTFIEILSEDEVKSWVIESNPDEIAILMLFFNPMCHPSVMIRKSFLKEHNLTYSAKALYAEEYHLWKEIIFRGGRLANLPEVLIKYRSHKKSITRGLDTRKIQERTANNVKKDLFNHYFNGRLMQNKLAKNISYPFEESSPKKIYLALDNLKKSDSAFTPKKALDEIEKKYCGIPCTMDIFFASDDKFSQHLSVAITSILINSLPFEKFNFYVLDGGITELNKSKINQVKNIKKCSIEFIPIDDALFENLHITKECAHISKQTYYRYLIPQLKPNLDKCLYLDCDIVVIDTLNKLWHTNIGENYICAVEELNKTAPLDCKRLNIDNIFNAGVILINNKKWQQNKITEKLFHNTAKLVENKILKWVDQDVLNYTFSNKVKFVLPKYNLQQNAYFNGQHSLYSSTQLENSKKNPVIIHFNGNLKPWNNNCLHPLWKNYYKYLKHTAYKTEYRNYIITRPFKKILEFIYKKKNTTNGVKYKFFNFTIKKKIIEDSTLIKTFLGIRYYKKKMLN